MRHTDWRVKRAKTPRPRVDMRTSRLWLTPRQRSSLLSATPLLQEPSSLLRLFHLLSPTHFPLDGLDDFIARLENRDELGTLYANLDAQSPVAFLTTAVTGLRKLLESDAYALGLLDAIDAAIGSEDGMELERSVRRARAYVGEAYRMFGRMIRTRRAAGLAEEFPVLGRELPTKVYVGRDDGVAIALDAWREYVAAGVANSGLDSSYLRAAQTILEGAFGAGDALSDAVQRATASCKEVALGEGGPLLDEAQPRLRDRARCGVLDLRRLPVLRLPRFRVGSALHLALGTEAARRIAGRAPRCRI